MGRGKTALIYFLYLDNLHLLPLAAFKFYLLGRVIRKDMTVDFSMPSLVGI